MKLSYFKYLGRTEYWGISLNCATACCCHTCSLPTYLVQFSNGVSILMLTRGCIASVSCLQPEMVLDTEISFHIDFFLKLTASMIIKTTFWVNFVVKFLHVISHETWPLPLWFLLGIKINFCCCWGQNMILLNNKKYGKAALFD